MRTYILSFLVLLSLTLIRDLNAQPSWGWQNPRPQGNNLTLLQAPDSQVAYAAGDDGAVVKTTDGGTNWQLLHFPRPISSQSLQFTDHLNGWVTGVYSDSVYLFSTSDGGSTWFTQFSSRGAIISFSFPDAFHTWLGIDSSLYRSTNGGTSWQLLYSGFSFVQLHFDNANAGWGIGNEFFLRTTDGGSSWVTTIVNLGLGESSLQQCRFVDTTVGWMIGRLTNSNYLSGHVLKTTDGGATWQQQLTFSGAFDYLCFTDIDPVSRDVCWTVASDGSLYKTTNGGANWLSLPRVANLNQLAVLSNGTLLGAGSFGNQVISIDSGLTWSQTSSGYTMLDASDMMVLDSTHVFAVGGRTLLKTADGGIHWNSTTMGSGLDFYSRSVWFTDSLRGWVGAEYTGGWGGLHRTTDGGQNWLVQVDSTHRITDLHFVNGSLGWFGEGGRVHFTSNGGESWSLRGYIPSIEIYTIFFASPTSGWAGGYIGLWHSTDGGTTWNEVRPGGSHLYAVDIFFLDPETGWVLTNGGNAGSVFRTTDGGTTWNSCSLGPHPFMRNVEFLDRTHGSIVGPDFSQIILSTTDGGVSWNQEESPTSLPLQRIRFSKNGNGWLLAEGGLILHTANLVTTVREYGVANPSPQIFELSQNYPNPFNPSTTISVSLQEQSNLRLIVFDVLGRRVREFVYEQVPAGVHEIAWDGNNSSGSPVASGVYLYRVTAGQKAITHRMLLLK